MDSQTISQGASGNQANHNSIQVNGAVGDRVQIRRALIKTLKISTPQVTAPSSSTIKDDFYFGPIPALEEDQDEGFESETMQDLTPGISEADFHQIIKTNTSLMENYKMLLKRTPNMKATCVKQLRDKARDQQIRIKFHVTQVQQWFTATGNSGQIQVSMSDSSVEDLKQRLASICSKLQDAINSLPRGPTRSRGRSSEGKIRNSKMFRDLDRLIENIGFDVSAIESLIYRLSNFQPASQSTKSFTRLYVSSSATKTLYRHLCEACPVNGQEQAHGHTALVGLVPVQEYEPLCINPNDVAVTGHHVAIESNFNKGDYIWFEAHSRLVLPKDDGDAVYSEPSSPLVTVINGLRQRWRRDSGYSSVTAASSDERSQTSHNITEFCRIQVCPGSLAQGSDRLAMCIAVDQDSGHQIFYLDENKRPKTSCKPLTLSKIIREGEHGRLLSNKRKKHRRYVTLFHRSRSLRNSRFKLALKLAEATIRYGWQEWLGDGWGTQDIKFYPIESEKMPFLRATMFDHGSARPKRFMYHLGHVLLKLGLWKELKGPIIQQQLDKELSRLGTETSIQYQEAVRYCIAYGESSSDEQSDYETFQRNFYQSVISPLREMVKRGEMDDMECQETIN
ncbi:uncharacterized protein FFNC_08633 [Fusarium fujikuroi]|uniref:Uncharacterized protein n=1 Tax=Fusarium fujikuroi TaxID=5127 RepID=A0A9Q9RMQ2_FUSFU|nr:uncharacterized protein FFNC_08633 [Fusarium fujikuroi]SCV31990.1 uncharacterized protein FFFS_03077 [Fusarium fujikuroi]VTT72291.1 unnamed protein product [Fusarium fujikuroi]